MLKSYTSRPCVPQLYSISVFCPALFVGKHRYNIILQCGVSRPLYIFMIYLLDGCAAGKCRYPRSLGMRRQQWEPPYW